MCKPAFKEIATDLAMDLFHEARKKGFDYQDLADFVGSTPLTMKAYTYGDGTPSLAVFIGVWKRVKPERVLKILASWSGYAVFKLPDTSADSFPLLSKKTASTLQEFSEFIDSIGNATLDSRITKREAEKIKKEGMEAIEKILETIKTAQELAR